MPDANPGRASNVFMTDGTKKLRQLLFESTCKVDKGFIVDNEAAAEGVIIDQPVKRQKKQVYMKRYIQSKYQD